jgi:hypothetical protein
LSKVAFLCPNTPHTLEAHNAVPKIGAALATRNIRLSPQRPSSSSPDTSPHRPSRMIRLRSCCFGADDPPLISSEPQARPSVSLLRRDTSAFALVSSALVIRFRSSCFGATSYLIDADRLTLSFDPEALDRRSSTGYPIETYLTKLKIR